MHKTIGIFGDLEFFKKFGKTGTENDLLIRNQPESGNVLTFVAPNSERIQSLVQAAAMSDYPIVIAGDLTPQTGETFMLLDEMGFDCGLIATDFHEERIRAMIKDMNISKFEFCKIDEQAVREKMLSFKKEFPAEPVLVTIDNYFPVKGVGTVILGLVKSGKVKQYDNLTIYPTKKQVTIKSMQSQDKDVKETEPGHRIGLALKGIETDELKRGYVFSDKEITCKKEIEIDAKKSRFSRYEFAIGKKLLVSCGLLVVSGDVRSIEGSKIKIELDSMIPIIQDKCILINPDSVPRIIGSGVIL
jgi:selenocysteine-specific translation elongation factor